MRYCVEFWDHGAWNEWASTGRFKHRQEAVAVAQQMNRETCHEERRDIFEGRRFRVRSVEGDR